MRKEYKNLDRRMSWSGLDTKNLVGKLTNKKYFISIPSFQSILSLFKIKQVI